MRGDGSRPRSDRIEYCHAALGSVFGALSDCGRSDVEATVMERYRAWAPTTTDEDHLCLALLARLAVDLRDHLGPADRAAVLDRAADRLPPAGGEDPLAAAGARLADVGLAADCTVADLDMGVDSAARVLTVEEYALPRRDGALPVLPFLLECRRRTDRPVGVRALHRVDDATWEWAVTPAATEATTAVAVPGGRRC